MIRFLGIFLIFMGALVLIGKNINSAILVQIYSGSVPMATSTAACFILSGMTFLAIKQNLNTVGFIISAIIFLISGIIGIEYLLDLKEGIDSIFNQWSFVSSNKSFQSVMAPNTAFCFILSALALICTFVKHLINKVSCVSQIFGSIVLGIGLVAIMGYANDVRTGYGWQKYTPMAINTAFCFVLLAIGILYVVEKNNKNIKGKLSFSFVGVFVLGTTMIFSIWQAVYSMEREGLETALGSDINYLIAEVKNKIKQRATVFGDFVNISKIQSGIRLELFKAEAREHTVGTSEFMLVRWIDADGSILWDQMKDERGELEVKEIFEEQQQKEFISGFFPLNRSNQNLQQREFKFSKIFNTKSGKKFIFLSASIIQNKQFQGVIVGIIDVSAIFNDAANFFSSMFNFEVYEAKEIYESPEQKQAAFSYFSEDSNHEKFKRVQGLDLYNIKWLFEFKPTNLFLNRKSSKVSTVILILGCFLMIISLLALRGKAKVERLKDQLVREKKDLIKSKERLLLAQKVDHALLEKQEIDEVIHHIMKIICDIQGWVYSGFWKKNPATGALHCLSSFCEENKDIKEFEKVSLNTIFEIGVGLPGLIVQSGKSFWVSEVSKNKNFIRAKAAEKAKLSCFIAVPIKSEKETLGVLEFFGHDADVVDSSFLEDLEALGFRIGQFVLRRNSEMKIVELAKMSALGEMASGIAHEINNPLAIIHGKAAQIRKKIESGNLEFTKANEDLSKIEVTAERIAKIVKGLRSFSRNSEADPMYKVKISQIIEETLELCRARFKNASIDLQVICNEDIIIECRSAQISQILLNLLGNSHDAIDRLPEKWIKLEVNLKKDFAIISVTDSGKGIPPIILDKIMQPFYTTKGVGKGTGLGLSISRGIAENHGGQLRYDTTCLNTRFIIELPIRQMKI